jgi:hypothetical protein
MRRIPNLLLVRYIIILILCLFGLDTIAQLNRTDSLKRLESRDSLRRELMGQYDIGDLYNSIFRRNRTKDSTQQSSGISVIPNIAANPTIGYQIGIKAVGGKKLGYDPETFMSVAATSASITTKGILYFYLIHNVFTPQNKWNLQGSLVAARTVSPDYGLGIGARSGLTPDDLILSNSDRKPYVLNALYFNFREKIYKNVAPNWFVGAGFSFDIRRNIQDRTSEVRSPYKIYSERNGFDPQAHSSNGLLFNVQYTSRDNQNRAYKGIYADAGVRVNQSWMGSTQSATVINTDFRKYFSLSKLHPEHVLAFWNWNAFVTSGALPYFELPGTGRDATARSGRGYTTGYFIGTQFSYGEAEYRFPITKNKFLSGVAFINAQTANDGLGTRLFDKIQPGGGAGLRVLFNKAIRTNLCLDYAWGSYGKRGFFLGINEAF